MEKIIAITQARYGSTRLPAKILKTINNQSLLEIHLNRIKQSKLIDSLYVATTFEQGVEEIINIAKSVNIDCYQGSTDDVLARFYALAESIKPKYVVRLTSDCPLIDAKLIDAVIQHALDNDLDYCSNTLKEVYPDGLDVEIFKFSALEDAYNNAKLKSEREHVTPYIVKNSTYKGGTLYRSDVFSDINEDFGDFRITVDEQADFNIVKKIIEHKGVTADWQEYIQFLVECKQTGVEIDNEHIVKNAGYIKSLKEDRIMSKTGQDLYDKAKDLIPGGTMLLSKRPEMFLPDKWPAYYSKSKGCSVWDMDGNEYLDMSIMGIGTNSLGYGNEAVDNAVRKVIDSGNMSTLNCPEEVALAERLVAMHPWADMARFCRSGGEANAVAIRIARAATGKDKVAICGYHGWHDWYISTNINSNDSLSNHLLAGLDSAGVPKALEGTTVPFMYNDIEEFKRVVADNPDLGVVKMEVCRNAGPKTGYLEEIRRITKEKGIVLIFDECTSGFRETFGGLHKKYGVEPDMAMFGKALGNGYAVTGVIGRREVMQAAQKTFISSTFWTERIGSAAALATLDEMERLTSWQKITETGKNITSRWQTLADTYQLTLNTAGLPALTSFSIDSTDWLKYKTFITQEMLQAGILASNSIYVCTEHNDTHIERYFTELEKVFAQIKSFESKDSNIDEYLKSPVCHAGFKRLN